MKKYVFLFLLLYSFCITAQNNALPDSELSLQLDSILTEGILLYKYEKAAWISTDLALANPAVKNNFGGYFSYEKDSLFRTVILDKENENCIVEYVFMNEIWEHPYAITEKRALHVYEKEYLAIRNTIIDQLSDPEYEIGCPDGYSLNLVLIPDVNSYKFYILTGTSQSGIIPFGNDYLFCADSFGQIYNWQKFHSRLIPAHIMGPNGEKIVEVIHSHLAKNPLMSATDICTFLLYGALYQINSFSVYSPVLNRYMTYNMDENKITVRDAD